MEAHRAWFCLFGVVVSAEAEAQQTTDIKTKTILLTFA